MYFLFLFYTLLIQTLNQLIFIQQSFRHGARYPIRSLFNSYPSQYLGQLTSQGKRMHYLLGKKMYQQYWQKLGLTKQYNSSYFYVRSTDYNRTIQSAQSHLLGIFSQVSYDKKQNIQVNDSNSFSFWKYKNQIELSSRLSETYLYNKFLPIHIYKSHVNGTVQDFLLNYQYMNCLQQQKWGIQNQQSIYYLNLQNLINKYCDLISKEFDLQQCNISTIIRFVDVYYATKFLGGKVHQLFQNQSSLTDLIYLYTQGNTIIYFLQDIQINSTATPFLYATRKNLQNVVLNKSLQKWIIYSAHDLTLLNILAAMKLTSAKCVQDHYLNKTSKEVECIWQYPPYASNLIVELEKQGKEYMVKIRYNGIYRKLIFCRNEIRCKYEQFMKYLNETILEDYLQKCDVKLKQQLNVNISHQTSHQKLLIGLITIFLFLQIVYIIYRILEFFQKRNQQSEDDKERLKKQEIQMGN